jgi:hypothetical protein
MDILACLDGEYHIKLGINNKSDNFMRTLVVMYGAA